MQNSKLSVIVATIQATDLDNAIAYYEQFGFSKDWIWPDADPTHASLSKDSIGFMVTKVDKGHVIQKADLYFRISNVEEFYNHLKSKGIIDIDLIKSDYGMLDFTIKDPWGHTLSFGEPHGDFQS